MSPSRSPVLASNRSLPRLLKALALPSLLFFSNASAAVSERAQATVPQPNTQALAPTKRREKEFVDQLALPNESWTVIADGFSDARGVATDCLGHPYFADTIESKVFSFDESGRPEPFVEESGRAEGQAFGPDGLLYSTALGQKKIVAYKTDGSMNVVADGLDAREIVVTRSGLIYATQPASRENPPGGLWLILPGSPPVPLPTRLHQPSGLALSPDKTQLHVADAAGIHTFLILSSGGLANERTLFRFQESESAADSKEPVLIPLKTDVDGRIYAGTREGLQVIAPDGTNHGVFPVPGRQITSFDFGGAGGDVLFVATGDRILKRRVSVRGARAFLETEPPTVQ